MDTDPVPYDIIRYSFIPHPEHFIEHLFKTEPLFL